MQRIARTTALVALAALAVAGCSDDVTSPKAPSPAAARPAAAAVKFWDANATASWNERATMLAARRAPVNVFRLYAYLSLAQFRAAEEASAIEPHGPVSSAIGAASAAVLNAYFPADIGETEGVLDAQQAAAPWPGAKHEDFAQGEAIGRAVAARVLAWSAGDRFGLTDPVPTRPTPTEGSWKWSPGMPLARGSLGARPFYLSSTDELRPPPPPAFGSADYLAALDEVRYISAHRTDAQLASARYWHVNQSPSNASVMNNLAVELIRTHRRGDAESARILFLMSSAVFDATIGCFDAKYAYWFIRPTQADPSITIPSGVTLPAHPSYPSAHSCISGASTGVLGAAFPSERARVDSIANEAGMSRVYAGLHYRFDSMTGIALGQAAAAKAMAADLDLVAIR